MTTTTKPRQLNKDAFVRRLRELIDEGLPQDQIVERMDPVRGTGLAKQFLIDAVETISSAVAIAHDVRNQAMVQGRKDFVNRERYATEFDGVCASTRAHIERSYKDAPIRAAKLKVVDVEQRRRRAMADQASEDWTQLQIRRATFDRALQSYPQAFTDEERKPLKLKPV